MTDGDAARELGQSRLHVLTRGGRMWRSPLFIFENHGLIFFQTWDYSRPRPTANRPPQDRRFVVEIIQQVNYDWQPLYITGFGGGGSERMVHWIELELPNGSASAIRIRYGDPVLTAIDDQFTIGP